MNRIKVIADTHGAAQWAKLVIACEGKDDMDALDAEDFVIVAGDYDLFLDEKLLAQAENLAPTILIVDGNHDAHDAIGEIVPEPYLGGMARKLGRGVYALCRGHVFDIAGRSIFCMGGARSVDAIMRTPGIDWWPELELPSFQEEERGFAELAKRGWCVDYVISHDTSTGCAATLLGRNLEPSSVNEYLKRVYARTEFRCALFGHHHQDRFAGGRYRCVYEDVVELVDGTPGIVVAYDHADPQERTHRFEVDGGTFARIETYRQLVYLRPADAAGLAVRVWDRIEFACPGRTQTLSAYVRRVERACTFAKVAKCMGIAACGHDNVDELKGAMAEAFPCSPFYALGFELGSVHLTD